MRARIAIGLAGLLALAGVAACDAVEAELTTTTMVIVGTTEPPVTTTTVGEEATTTTLRGQVVTEYAIIVREPHDEGEIYHIVIPPGAYTNVDIENFLGDLLEANEELWGAEVFDSEEALLAYQTPEEERTEEEQELIDRHHFATMTERLVLTFRGPFAELGTFIIGS